MIFSPHSSKTFLSALIIIFCSIQFITCPEDIVTADVQSNTNGAVQTQSTLTEDTKSQNIPTKLNQSSQGTSCPFLSRSYNFFIVKPLMFIRDSMSKFRQIIQTIFQRNYNVHPRPNT